MYHFKRGLLCISCALALCGCATENEKTEAKEEEKIVYSTELNDRQKEILAEMDLPQEFFELSDSQQNAITVIDLALKYAEETYGGEFKYVTYYGADLMDGSPQTVVMYQVGDEAQREISVGVKFKDGVPIYTDDYKELMAVEEYTAAISEYISEKLPGEEFKLCYFEVDDYRDGTEPIVQRASSGAFIVMRNRFRSVDDAKEFMKDLVNWLYSNNKCLNRYYLDVFDDKEYYEITEDNLDEYRRKNPRDIYEICTWNDHDGNIDFYIDKE